MDTCSTASRSCPFAPVPRETRARSRSSVTLLSPSSDRWVRAGLQGRIKWREMPSQHPNSRLLWLGSRGRGSENRMGRTMAAPIQLAVRARRASSPATARERPARQCGTVIRGTGRLTWTWRRLRSSRWARCAPRRAASTRRARCGESQLGKLPRHRQKLAFARFSGWPVWVDDDSHFDLDYHLRHTALPAPGSEEDPAGLPRASGRKIRRTFGTCAGDS